MSVPFLDLKAQYQSIQNEIKQKIQSVLDSSQFILGSELLKFEEEFAAYIGSQYSLGLNSGTGALLLSLKALNIGNNDEVITVSNSFIATWEAIELSGAISKFVDISPDTFLIDPEKIQSAITKKTKAIIPIHLYGSPCTMDVICKIARQNGLFVIEDACQAHGAVYQDKKVGNWGDVGCFSFYPGKNLGAYGDGGAITTNNETVYNKIKMLRDHGRSEKYNHEMLGYNDRLDNIQAGILRVKLKHLEEWNCKRRSIAKVYTDELGSFLQNQKIHEKGLSAYHLYVIRTNNRNSVLRRMQDSKITCGLHYPIPIHKQKIFKDLHSSYDPFLLRETEKHCETVLSLPIYPELSNPELVINTLKKILKQLF